MSDYTPTTAYVRESYVYSNETEGSEKPEREFDHWLAAHEAEVYQRARKDAEREVLNLRIRHCTHWLADKSDSWECIPIVTAAAAARGDGEAIPPQMVTFDLNDGYYEMRDGRIEQYAPLISRLTPNADERALAADDLAYPLLMSGEITKDEYEQRIAAARGDGSHE